MQTEPQEGATVPLKAPVGGFRTILADPPWRYHGSLRPSDAIDERYGTMTQADICALRVSELAAKNAVLLLWCTWPKLQEGMACLNAWGFSYVSGFPWVKMAAAGVPRMGLGFHTRSVSEVVLIGTKGVGLTPLPEDRLPGIIFSPAGKHSRKPDEQYVFAEKYGGPYLEIFGRPSGDLLFPDRPDWVRLGNELTGNDIRVDIETLINSMKGV